MMWRYPQDEANWLWRRLRSATRLFVALVLVLANWLTLEWGRGEAERADLYRERVGIQTQLLEVEAARVGMALQLAGHCESIIRQVALQLGLEESDPLVRVVQLRSQSSPFISGGIGGSDAKLEVARLKLKKRKQGR